MKILFLTHRFYPEVGGIEVNSEILASCFTSAGHEVRLVTWTPSSKIDEHPFPIIRRPSTRRLISEHCWADVVYENNPCMRLSWPAMFLTKPSVVAIRTWIQRNNGRLAIRDRMKMWQLSRAKGVIAVSKAVQERCFPSAVVIGNPYRSGLFKADLRFKRDRDFVFLGRLVSDKGVDMTIRALSKINDELEFKDRLRLTIIGDGPERVSLCELAHDSGIGDCVDFAGVIEGPALVEMLNRHRFMWVPSRWLEPFGNVVLEGMACNCIPIVSDGGGLPDAVGDAGLTFRRNNLPDMVRQTKRLLSNTSLCNELADNATRHLEMHLPTNVAKRYLDVIEQSVER